MRSHPRAYPFLLLLVVLAWCAAVPVSAAAQGIPPRPVLPAGADANDWEAYFDLGAAKFRANPAEAHAAFYWATRLAPERAEPLFGQWAAFWMRDFGRWEQYIRSPERARQRPEVVRADSLLNLAYMRNPFVHRGLEAVLYDELPGRWRQDNRTRAWLEYATGNLPKAIEFFERAIRNDPNNPGVRFDRACALVSAGRFADALGEMTVMVGALRERDATRQVGIYESKAMLEYGIGLLHLAQRDPARAREAFARALLDDLGFAPAHAALADLASARGDHGEAVRAYEQALELSPDDPVFRFAFAGVLLRAGQLPRAEEQTRAAIALAPDYAEPYAQWGSVLERLGRPREAEHAYAGYLQRAPARAPRRAAVQARLSAVRAAGGTDAPRP